MAAERDDENDSSDLHIFYQDRPEWNDVEPISQDDGSAPVVSIDYSPRFQDVYNYFRGVLATGEKNRPSTETN